MKKLVLSIALLIASAAAFAQAKKTEDAPKSKIEAFSDRSGTMTKKEYIDIQKISGVKFQVLKITDLTSNVVVSGLRIEGQGSGTYSSSRVAFLDSDEIDGFIKALDYINGTVLAVGPPANDVEYHFTSRSGFEAGAYNYKGKWFTFLKLEKYMSDSNFNFSIDEVEKVKAAVVEAKGKI